MRTSPEEALLRREMRQYVRSHIHQLSSPLREPVVLYFFHHMPQREIAAHLHISYDAVRKRLQQAREILQEQLEPYFAQGHGDPVAPASDPEADMAVSSATSEETIASPVVAIRMVQIVTRDGVERYVPLALDHKPARQQQKLATLHAYVQRHPGGWRKQEQLAELLYTMGDWEQAVSFLQHVHQRQPPKLDVRLRLAQMLRGLRRESEAIEVYQGLLTSTEGAAMRHYLNGCIALCHRHIDEAAALYAEAAALKPDHARYGRALGLTWLQASRAEAALHAFDKMLQDDPDDLVALTFSYRPLLSTGRSQEARERTERAWQLDPGNALALAQLVDGHCHMGHVRGCVDTQTRGLIRRARQLAGEVPEVVAAQAHYHIARDEQSTGLRLLQQYTVNHPNNPDGWHNYVYWLYHSGALVCPACRRMGVANDGDVVLATGRCTNGGIHTEICRPTCNHQLVDPVLLQQSIQFGFGENAAGGFGDDEIALRRGFHKRAIQKEHQVWLGLP
ncbi:MAG: hypothetical protein ETSY2_49760 [Candidatus Entotheonella gemina]|uniref:RNA polymerase sigma factor 70 region 4 type 2 domain-containing protein n=1 Tax=Candidatus Entotheonella gemina TaxID=1429439 RepID=W4L9A0_9BACT|nr:MAG: hypothetical protein ETSY2_49760 [Candidatus Entotheonella gemina]